MTIQFFKIFRDFVVVFHQYKPGIRKVRVIVYLYLICINIVLGKIAFYIVLPLRYMIYYIKISTLACDTLVWLNYFTEFFYATQNFTMGSLVLFMCYYLAKMETIIFQNQTSNSLDNKDGS
jgi:hypothetical protein